MTCIWKILPVILFPKALYNGGGCCEKLLVLSLLSKSGAGLYWLPHGLLITCRRTMLSGCSRLLVQDVVN